MTHEQETPALVPSSEETRSEQISVSAQVEQIAEEMRMLTSADIGTENTETYGEQARRFFFSVRQRWNALADAGQEKEAESVTDVRVLSGT